jgi:hypothetical protein
MRLVRALSAGALGALLFTGVAACGGEKATEDIASSSSARPEDLRTSAAEVAAGLRVISELASDVVTATGTDKDGAKAAHDEIEPTWLKIEGTVKENDQDAYIALEDALAVLAGAVESADQPKAGIASEKVTSLASAYLARFPSDGSTPAPTATPASTATSSPSASSPSATSPSATSGSSGSSAAVAAGLKEIDQIARSASAAAGSNAEEAQALVDRIEPVWKSIEDALRAKDQDSYLTLEDAFAALGKAVGAKDGAAAKSASDKISTAVDDHVKRFAA